jgi:hypothetical protein
MDAINAKTSILFFRNLAKNDLLKQRDKYLDCEMLWSESLHISIDLLAFIYN